MGVLRTVSDITDRRGVRKVSRAMRSLLVPVRKAWALVPCQSHWHPLALGATATPSKDLEFSMRRINRTLQGCGAIGLAKTSVQFFLEDGMEKFKPSFWPTHSKVPCVCWQPT